VPDPSQFNTDRTYPGLWTITFSNPPINMFGPGTMLAAERGGTQFTDEEILGNLIQIIPGPDALMMLISNAVLTLLRRNPPSGYRY
jgi:hypothetical protein